jgi:murein DD-endopeptidase MepM/ murein hydrolase activator NlpD
MSEPIFEITSYDPKAQKIRRARLHSSARPKPRPWQWPLARLGGRDPIVLADYADVDRRGVELGYVAAPFDSELFVPVFAAQAGEVSFALEGKDGFAISLDHGAYSTHYAHLSKMFVTRCLPKLRRRQYVPAGEVIGYAAKAPVHVRFELWERAFTGGFEAIDPRPFLRDWSVPPAGNTERSASAPNPDHEAA